MNKKIILYLVLAVVLALAFVYVKQAVFEHEETTPELQEVKEPLHHMETIKKALTHFMRGRKKLPTTDILLEEIVKLSDMDLSNGAWDDLGVYTTPNFIYMGGCYSQWCYAEADRKDNSYTLLLRHDGKRWQVKACATQGTELGRRVCEHLKLHGWAYLEGEM